MTTRDLSRVNTASTAVMGALHEFVQVLRYMAVRVLPGYLAALVVAASTGLPISLGLLVGDRVLELVSPPMLAILVAVISGTVVTAVAFLTVCALGLALIYALTGVCPAVGGGQ